MVIPERHTAEKTHGKFYTVADADDVLKDLPVGGRVRMKAPPSAAWTWWNAPMFFPAALLALTTERFLRKQKNLVQSAAWRFCG
jgi:hypothetical protein